MATRKSITAEQTSIAEDDTPTAKRGPPTGGRPPVNRDAPTLEDIDCQLGAAIEILNREASEGTTFSVPTWGAFYLLQHVAKMIEELIVAQAMKAREASHG